MRSPGRLLLALLIAMAMVLLTRAWRAGMSSSSTEETPQSRITEKSAPRPADAVNPGPSGEPSHAGAVNGDFKQELSETLRSFPTLSQLRALTSEQAHLTPKPLLDAATAIARIRAALKADPSLIEEVSRFYQECAARSDLASPIRALCYSHLKALPGNRADTLTETDVPDSIRRLSGKLDSR